MKQDAVSVTSADSCIMPCQYVLQPCTQLTLGRQAVHGMTAHHAGCSRRKQACPGSMHTLHPQACSMHKAHRRLPAAKGTAGVDGLRAQLTTVSRPSAGVYMQRLYARSAREVRRLETIAKSPIYSNFEEILQGAAVIRGCGAQVRMAARNFAHLAQLQRADLTGVPLHWLALVTVHGLGYRPVSAVVHGGSVC